MEILRILKNSDGVAAIEYGLIMALFAMVTLSAVKNFGGQI